MEACDDDTGKLSLDEEYQKKDVVLAQKMSVAEEEKVKAEKLYDTPMRLTEGTWKHSVSHSSSYPISIVGGPLPIPDPRDFLSARKRKRVREDEPASIKLRPLASTFGAVSHHTQFAAHTQVYTIIIGFLVLCLS